MRAPAPAAGLSFSFRILLQPRAASAKAEREIARLEAKRARIVDLRADGLIGREECAKRLSAIDQEVQTARAASAQSALPAIDIKALARGLAGAFALFASLPFDRAGSRQVAGVLRSNPWVDALAKASHLAHLQVASYITLIAAADTLGHPGVGVLLESCLADKLAFMERTRQLIRITEKVPRTP
jgi:hypothetical protein